MNRPICKIVIKINERKTFEKISSQLIKTFPEILRRKGLSDNIESVGKVKVGRDGTDLIDEKITIVFEFKFKN